MRRVWGAAVLLLAIDGQAASAAEGMKAFAALDSNSAAQMRFAMQFADRLLAAHESAQFEILAGGKAIVMLSDRESPVLEELATLVRRYPRLKLLACRETTGKMREQGIPVRLLRGANEVECTPHVRSLAEGGWFRVDTTSADEE